MSRDTQKLGFNATWSMAVGGMVGGGIFAVLGVVVERAGQWAWLSFLVGGVIALATAYSYAELSARYGESGGAFLFLRKIHHEGVAGSLSWVLIVGYVLTLSVYAFTFGHYVGEVIGWGDLAVRTLAVGIIVILALVNLRGVGGSALLEIVTVWGKVALLVALAIAGLIRFRPEALTSGIEPRGLSGALLGTAAVFMAYEGFQLLTYDYDEIRKPNVTLRRALLLAVVAVTGIYIVVTLGATSLVGAGTIVEEREIALAAAGRQAWGTLGVVLVSVAAAFSTGSAINATLFATARLADTVATDGELPAVACHRNTHDVPDRALLVLAAMGAALAAIGSLGSLVEAASLVFLFTFGVVNMIAVGQLTERRWIPAMGALGATGAVVILVIELVRTSLFSLIALGVLILIATTVRPLILRHTG